MTETFEKFYRNLARATAVVLFAALGFLGLALLSALAGFANAVVSFREASLAVGYVFAVLFAVFLVTSVVGALVRYLTRRTAPTA